MQPNVDLLADNLIHWGKMARSMPRSFDAAGVVYNIGSPDGLIAKMLPGRGVMPLVDLKALGIHRQPPHVYDPSKLRHLADNYKALAKIIGWVGEEPMVAIEGAAISTYDGIIANRGAGKAQDRTIFKGSLASTANLFSLMFRATGQPGAGVALSTTAPPTDALLDRSTTGALTFFNSNPTSPDKFYLLTFGFTATNQINMLILIDMLQHSGAYRLSVATAETVTTPTNATRLYGPSGGVGNLYTAYVMGAGTPGAGTSIFQYVDQGGVATNSPTMTVAATVLVQDQLWPNAAAVTAGAGSFFIPLDVADTGVQAVKQHTLSVAGTGQLNAVVFFPIFFLPGIAASAYVERDTTTQIDGITELVQASGVIGCLNAIVLPNTTTTGVLTAHFKAVTG